MARSNSAIRNSPALTRTRLRIGRVTGAPRLALLATGLIALLAAWVVATPPWAGPDEAAHYLRALTLTQGHLLGTKTGVTPANQAVLNQGGILAEQQRFIVPDQRSLLVPARLSPPNVACVDGRPDQGAGCVETTYEGNFPPLGYLLPAAALATAQTQISGLWRSRAASAVETLAFLLLAVLLIGWRSGWPLVGLLAAVPPGALNIGSILGPSGLETAANLAFIAALLKLDRERGVFAPAAWVALALSGMVTILAWQLGPLFVAFDLLGYALLAGRDGWRGLVAQRRCAARAAAGLVVAAVVFLVYGKVSGVLHSDLDFHHLIRSLHGGWIQTKLAVLGGIGSFDQGQIALSSLMVDLWVFGVLVLLGAALVVARPRERLAVGLVAALGFAFPILFYAFSLRSSGFGLQGRHVLPVLALIPLVACQLLDRRALRGRSRTSPVAAAWLLSIAAYQGVAWWHHAHFWAGAGASRPLLAHSTWSPPLGWGPWVIVAASGTLALGAAAASCFRRV